MELRGEKPGTGQGHASYDREAPWREMMSSRTWGAAVGLCRDWSLEVEI
jgi:hypothetical protein